MYSSNPVYVAYVPHGINSKYFRPIDTQDSDYEEFIKFKTNFKTQYKCDFIVFWNNRNIRRKQPGDVILAFKEFVRLARISNPQANPCLFMHTQVRDDNGTDLAEVKRAIAPECTIVFSDAKISTQHLNYYYNLADVTLNIASNEGFGLSGAESLMAGTPIVNNVTGGLQDQCRFEDDKGNWIVFDSTFTTNHTGKYKKCAPWAYPVFPSNRSLQGSPVTPYIFDDRCNYEDVAQGLYYWYEQDVNFRVEVGLKAREWMLGDESQMSAKKMSSNFIKYINHLIDNWNPVERYTFNKIDFKQTAPMNVGVVDNFLTKDEVI